MPLHVFPFGQHATTEFDHEQMLSEGQQLEDR